jgi:hypothetical protein
MTLRRFAILPSFLLIVLSAHGQTSALALPTPIKDSQAIALLQKSLKTMAQTVPLDSTASGDIQIVAGSQTSQGTILILTKGDDESFVEFTTDIETRALIYSSGQANERLAGKNRILPMETAVTSQAAEFPIPLMGALLNDPNTSFQYVGAEILEGLSLEHVRTWNSFASSSTNSVLSPFSTRDIWIDASSGLVQKISFMKRAARGASPSVPIALFFADYQVVSGVAYPHSIKKSVNGTPWATITIQSVSFNNGLTDSQFTVQ